MIDSLSFINASWFCYVITSAIVLLIIFILKEWYQSKNQRLYVNILIAFFGIFALSMIALKPAIETEIDVSKMAILTTNYDEAILDSLKNKHKNLRIENYQKGRALLDRADLPTSIFVLGQGIAPFDLWQLDSLKVSYINNFSPRGITKLKYQQNYIIGENATISGYYEQAIKGHKLFLENPGGQAIDSILLTSDNSQTFQLKADLNIIGNYTYTITEKDSLNRRIKSNPLPIKIKEQNNIRVLMINGFPTFETKYLKNYLAEMGHAVVVRSQITKGRFKYEYFNTENRPQTSLTTSNLEHFDLIIIDANSLLNISSTQRNNLENAIKENGLGLLIQPTSRLFRASSNLVPFTFGSDKTLEATFSNSKNITLSKYPYTFKKDMLLEPIHYTKATISSAYKHFGNGRISSTTYNNTFELVLNGKLNAYQKLWSDIITQTSKRQIKTLFWEQNDVLTFKDQPFNFKLRTLLHKPKVKSSFGYSIPIQQHVDISSVWQGTSYPKTSGWHKHFAEQDTLQQFDYFVNEPSDWEAFQINNIIKSNTNYFKNYSVSSVIQTRREPIRLIWFYIMLLSCFGYLWLEPKL